MIQCNQCGKKWDNKTEKPLKCPFCQTKKYNEIEIKRVKCKLCKKTWKPYKLTETKRCPFCYKSSKVIVMPD